MERIEYCHIEGEETPDLAQVEAPNAYGDYQGSAGNHSYVIDNVVSVVRGQAEPATSGQEGRLVVDIIQRMYAAADRI